MRNLKRTHFSKFCKQKWVALLFSQFFFFLSSSLSLSPMVHISHLFFTSSLFLIKIPFFTSFNLMGLSFSPKSQGFGRKFSVVQTLHSLHASTLPLKVNIFFYLLLLFWVLGYNYCIVEGIQPRQCEPQKFSFYWDFIFVIWIFQESGRKLRMLMMETMDYSDPEPNTNTQGGYVSPPPPNYGWF